MPNTTLVEVADQIQKFWSPIFADKLKEDTLLPSLVSKDYQGEMKMMGDTVYVSAIDRPTAVRKSVTDPSAKDYSTQALSTSRVAVQADTLIEAGVVIEDLAAIQSQIGDKESQIRQRMFEAIEIELNKYLYEKVAPSVAAPVHIKSGVTDFNASELGEVRTKASQAWWGPDRYLLCDPSYYQDALNAATLTGADYAPDMPTVGGKFMLNRMGFKVVEDNSVGMAEISPTTAASQLALAFVPDFMYFVMQKGITFKLSDLHATKERGYFLSAEMLVGAELGIEGAVKHQVVYNV